MPVDMNLFDSEIVNVECGAEHTVAITSNGTLFTWGWAEHGQLGHGNEESIDVPKPVEALKDYCVQRVACGGGHVLAACSKRE